MIDPNDVRPNNFQDHSVLYSENGFSIAFGTYGGNERCIGMRWDGEQTDDVGYPKLFKYPLWFILPVELSIPLLKSILSITGSNDNSIIRVLEELC